ncbi:MAG: ATP-binding cassette domain-containing protein [Gemmatimonadota bacterium]|nr:ATP-binding cassette domain-containing protein [Gemmatimonadota bacterium]
MRSKQIATSQGPDLHTPMKTETTPAGLSLRNLAIGYRRDRPVLHHLSLDIVPGEVLAVVGPNGSGKTTLFRTLLGVLPPIGGHAMVAGARPAEYRRRHGVGYLPEDTVLPPGWTCDGLLALAAAAAGPAADIERSRRLAGVDFDTSGLADKLSKGMRRRLALARWPSCGPRHCCSWTSPNRVWIPDSAFVCADESRRFAAASPFWSPVMTSGNWR